MGGYGATSQQWPAPMQLPPKPSRYPEAPTRYPQFWRAPGIKVVIPIVATLLLGLAFVALTTITVLVVLLATSASPAAIEAVADGQLTPELVLANSVSIALVLPCAFLIVRMVGQRPGFLSSVVGRFRWGFFWRCVAVVAAVFVVHTAISIAVEGVDSLGLQVRSYTWWLLVGLLLVTPFQAAAEEYLLRGFVFRTVASWIRSPIVAAVVGGVINSAIFAGLHGASDLWLNGFYFLVGATTSYLVWRTGGLEGAVALHVVNNMVGMAILPFQDMDAQFDRAAGAAGPEVLLQAAAMLLAAALIVLIAKRTSVATVGPPAAAEAEPPGAAAWR